MLSNNNNKNIGSSIPSPSFSKGLTLKKVSRIIEKTLLNFQVEHIRDKKDSEEMTSQFLINFLSDHAKSEIFIFCKEAIQIQNKGNSRRVDIGVFTHRLDRSPFFTIEAKRLPTPGGAHRKMEYVIGSDRRKHTGGIERYKLNLHGINIPKSAIVGYVEKKDFSHWEVQINNWIDTLIRSSPNPDVCWYEEDKLINRCDLSKDKVCRFNSKSIRNDKSIIELSHYFISLRTN